MKKKITVFLLLTLGLGTISIATINLQSATPVDASSPYYVQHGANASLSPLDDQKIQLDSQTFTYDMTSGATKATMSVPWTSVYKLTDTDTTARNVTFALPYVTLNSNITAKTPSYPSLSYTVAGGTTTLTPSAIHEITPDTGLDGFYGTDADPVAIEKTYKAAQALLPSDTLSLYHYNYTLALKHENSEVTLNCASTTDSIGVYTIPYGINGSNVNFYGSTYPTLETTGTTTATFNFYATKKLVPQQITYAYWSEGSYAKDTETFTDTFEPEETITFLAYCEKWSETYSYPVSLFKDNVAYQLHTEIADQSTPRYYGVTPHLPKEGYDESGCTFLDLLYTVPLTGGTSFTLTQEGSVSSGGDAHYDPYVFSFYCTLTVRGNYATYKAATIQVETGSAYILNSTFKKSGSSTYTYTDPQTSTVSTPVVIQYCTSASPSHRSVFDGFTNFLTILFSFVLPCLGLIFLAHSPMYVGVYIIVGISLLLGLIAMTVVLLVENSSKKKDKK